MHCHTDMPVLLRRTAVAGGPLELARIALTLTYPGGTWNDSSPAVIAAEVLDHAARTHAAPRYALGAAALTGWEHAPAWMREQIRPEALPHLDLLRALVVFVAHHVPANPAPLRLLVPVLADPGRPTS